MRNKQLLSIRFLIDRKPTIVFALIALCTLATATPSLGQISSEFPYEFKSVDLAPRFSSEALSFDAVSNPTGIFTSASGDTSSFSDAAAKQELISLHESGEESLIRYVDVGNPTGPTFLLFHGLPANSYLWRNVIPHLSEVGRVVAFDQIGFGQSSRHEDLSYTFKQGLAYTESFIDELGLGENGVVPVLHDSGGAYGLSYAARNPDSVEGLVFFETVLGPVPSFDVMPENAKLWRSDEGQTAIIDDNLMFEFQIRQSSLTVPPSDRPFTIRELTDIEIAAYEAPLLTAEDRRAIAQFPREIPIIGGADDGLGDTNLELWGQFGQYLTESDVPKLTFFSNPGVLATNPVADFVRGNVNMLTEVDFGDGFHFLQEDDPALLGTSIADWYTSEIVPEPTSAAPMLIATAALRVCRRRRRA